MRFIRGTNNAAMITAAGCITGHYFILAGSAFVPTVHTTQKSFGSPNVILRPTSLSWNNNDGKTRSTSCTTMNKGLFGSWENNSDHYEEAKARNLARTCVRQFLTQRALQSFMFLLAECRDPHTCAWIEEVTQTKNMLQYHGTGAINATRFESWDVLLYEMMQLPKQEIIVTSKRSPGFRRGSKNNPYLKDVYVEFSMNIDPASLTARIISVREQIAREWVDDIGILVQANNLILQSYFDLSKTARDQEKSKSDVVDEENKRQQGATDDSDSSADPLSNRYSETYSDKSKVAFVRTSRAYMNDMDSSTPVKSSPFRKGNFDLMLLLLTQESIHRVLRGFQDADERVPFEYLREFYAGRLRTFFDGNQPYGRADDFIEELLLTSPLVKHTEDGKDVGLVDPLYIAKKIIHMRNDVAQDWRKIVRNVPEEHEAIRNAALTRQIQSTLEREIMTTILEESKTTEGTVGFE
eukprot:scaffold18738_cov57-Attheya_sp.AAC.4